LVKREWDKFPTPLLFQTQKAKPLFNNTDLII